MKTKTKSTPPKAPKARVMYVSTNTVTDLKAGITGDAYKDALHCHAVAVIPLTQRQARLLVGFANLGEERRVEEVAEALQESNTLPYEWGTAHEDKVAQYQAHARAILSLTGLLSGQTARGDKT